MPDTDAEGHTTLPVMIQKAPDVTRPVKAEIDVEVDDPAGRASRASVSVPVRPAGMSIGIKPLFPDDAVDAKAEAAFDIAAVNPDGTRTALAAKLRLVRERPDWRMVMRGSLARYETVWKDEPLETRDIAISDGQPFRFTKRLDFGRYRIEVAQAGGMAITSYRFRSGWASSRQPGRAGSGRCVGGPKVGAGRAIGAHPHRSAVRRRGDVACVVRQSSGVTQSCRCPKAAPRSMCRSRRKLGARRLCRRPRLPRGRGRLGPGRALGLTWVGVDPAARTMAVSIEVPDKTLPRGRLRVPVKAAPGAWLTMAVVDEGILRLTRFASPDPAAHFLARRRLGLDIRDDWGRLIAPGDGEATLLKQGGDDEGTPLPDIPIRTVTLVHAAGAGRRGRYRDDPDRYSGLQWPGAADGRGLAGQPDRRRVDRPDRARSVDRRGLAAAIPGPRRRRSAGGAAAEHRSAGRRGEGGGQHGRTAGGARRGHRCPPCWNRVSGRYRVPSCTPPVPAAAW